ncbi:MAG: threonylcarbamoyl-AMP synthase [Candidatus Latescibacterota bacterium]|nr:MAG: threonylcarbamoyl-AMP synthase [Candidatus Latescibacterota bacterium]
MLLKLNPEHPQPGRVRKIVEVLERGGVVIYPTDTTYGIGCDLYDKRAIDRVYRIKEAERDKPLTFILGSLEDLSQYAVGVSNYAYRLMRRLTPGPYTFVLKASKAVPRFMWGKRKTVGIRIPDDPIPLAIVRELGRPIVNTSVSPPLDEFLSDPVEIERRYGKLVDVVVDGGVRYSDLSTVVDLTGEEPIVLRRGKGPVDLLE